MTDRRERLQKAIARSGLASRRRAEDLIEAGRVTVNGAAARLGDKIDPQQDLVAVDGVPLPVNPGLVYYLVNKPQGVVSSVSDPQGRPIVTELVPEDPRVWPVGRLDRDTEGLLILTNDGDLTLRVTHPRFGVEKRYRVLIEGDYGPESRERLLGGVQLDDGSARAIDVVELDRLGDRTLLEVAMGEGRKREVRRMCEVLGLRVVHLFRAAIGPVTDSRLRAGEWRELDPSEVRALYEASGPTVHTGAVSADSPTWVVAIDGPAGAGKTTVSRRVAEMLELEHLDTGAFYRVATLVVLRKELDPSSAEAWDAISAASFDFEDGRTVLGGSDVTQTIRDPDVTAAVSEVSAVPKLRILMVERQRDWVVERGGRAVVEGRDIGTVVFPDARLKVFLTATEEVRAARRSKDHPELDREGIAQELARRDHHDSNRATSPLSAADDAVTLDTSDFAFDDVVARVVDLAHERGF